MMTRLGALLTRIASSRNIFVTLMSEPHFSQTIIDSSLFTAVISLSSLLQPFYSCLSRHHFSWPVSRLTISQQTIRVVPRRKMVTKSPTFLHTRREDTRKEDTQRVSTCLWFFPLLLQAIHRFQFILHQAIVHKIASIPVMKKKYATSFHMKEMKPKEG